MACLVCRTFPAISTGTAAASVKGSGTTSNAAPKARSFFPVSLRSFTRSSKTAFVSRSDGGACLCETSDVASLINGAFLLASSMLDDKIWR